MKNRAVNSNLAAAFKRHKLAQAIISAPILLAPFPITAATAAESMYFSISPGSLGDALNQLGSQAKTVILFDPNLAKGQATKGFSGQFTVQQALNKLLENSPIKAVRQAEGGYILHADKDVTALDQVTVMGRNVRFGNAPPEPDGYKAEYQTTATKMAMSLKETPQAISVVTRDLMDVRQVDGLDHALELTTGVSGGGGGFASPGGPFTGRSGYSRSYVVRGYSQNYLHGVKTDGFSAGGLADIDLAAYERVEVVKGPSGFFGQGSIGGFINLTRKKPQAEFEASVSGQLGSYDTYRAEADITGSLTDDGDVRGRLVMVQGDEGSFVDDISTDTTLFAPSIEFEINDKTRALVQLLYQKEEFDVNNGQPMYLDGDRYRLFNLPRSFQFGAIGDDRSESEIKDISIRIDHEISDRWLGTLLLQRSETYKDAFQGNYGYYYSGNIYIGRNRDITDAERWTGELRVEGAFDAFDQEHKVLFGLEHSNRKSVRNNGSAYMQDSFGNNLTTDLYNPNFASFGIYAIGDVPLDNKIDAKDETKQKAAYLQTVLSVSDRTKLLFNARYDHSEFKSSHIAGGTNSERKDHELTLRLGLTQKLNQNLSAYAAYGESFETTYHEGRNGPLAPTRGEGYEIGLKGDWFDNKLGASLAIYRQDLTNRAVRDPNNGMGENYSIAAGLHRTEGIELEVAGSPIPGLNLSMAATWMDNEFLDDRDEFYGFSISGSVDRQFSIYANYEIQEGTFKGLATGLMYLNMGKQQLLPYQWPTGYSQAYIDGYERVDLDFSYNAVPNWDMSLVVRNVFDEKYIEQGSTRFSALNFVGAPRSALFKATYNF